MSNPFFVPMPESNEPVHKKKGHFSFLSNKGIELGDYDISENKTPYLGVSVNPITIRFAVILLAAIFFIFIGRAAYLQIINGSRYRAIAEGNRLRLETVPASRGIIYDANGQPLVQNIARFVLAVQPLDFPTDEAERDKIFKILASYDVDSQTILDTLKERGRSADWISVHEPIIQTQAVQLTVLLNEIPGISVRAQTRRQYLLDGVKSLSHVLGYMGKASPDDLKNFPTNDYPEMLGKSGLESAYENVLAGKDGKKQIEVDAVGNEKQVLMQENPRDGTHLLTSLDFDLQAETEKILSRTLSATGKKKGVVIAMNPKNGEILSLVSLPAFDDNIFSSGIKKSDFEAIQNDPNRPLFFRAISGTYPSGSTIKPIVAAGALEDGIITPRTSINSVGGVYVSQWFFPDWKGGGHGTVNVYGAIAESVNTFFYYIGGGYGNFKGLGPDRLAFWLSKFGFGHETGIDLPGESNGFVPTREWKEEKKNEIWYIGDTYHFAIGQGDLTVTPLQIASATSTIANGGTIYAPRVVTGFRASNGQEILTAPKVTAANFISPEVLKVIRDAMRQTVTLGVAKSLQEAPSEVAGKTGTAQWNTKKANHAWFTGFAPYKNPEITVTVLVEEGGEGSSIAVPIAKEIFIWYFNHNKK